MANFFSFRCKYANGSYGGGVGIRLWFLDGTKDEDGHKLLADLKTKKASGEITELWIDYES